MVFKHNKQPFADDESCQFAYKHVRQLDCGGQLASFAEHSSFREIPEKQPISDGERARIFSRSRDNVRLGGDVDNLFLDVTHKKFENKAADIPNACITEVVMSEHSKRPLSDDSSYQVAVKRTRQVDHDSRTDSSAEFSSFSSVSKGPPSSVAAGEELEKREPATLSEAKNTPSSVLSLSWFTWSTPEEDTRLETPVRLSFFPGYFEDSHRTTRFNQLEEIYSPVFEYPPRKTVAIGPNHQADVPVWRSQRSENPLRVGECSASAGHHLTNDDNSDDRWMGTCVMSMPDSHSWALEPRVGNRKTECSCPDEGSIRCVREHVMEAREELREKLGPDRFIQLGLCDMGEDVAACKWTEEEEELFDDVVLSNPASLGKNFWDELPQVFPSRSSRELVSYYFNVFMLRKRAEQNRSDPLNVDSDNDEWQDSDGGEFASTEEDDEDSAVESDRDDAACYNGDTEVDTHEEAEDGDGCAIVDEDNEELYDVSKGSNIDKSTFVPMDKNLQDGGEDQDDSCTSYEAQRHRVDPCGGPVVFVEPQDRLVGHREYINYDHEYVLDHCDPKTWEIGYIRGTQRGVDFLPTCNVIEEVFGKGSWENEERGGHGIV